MMPARKFLLTITREKITPELKKVLYEKKINNQFLTVIERKLADSYEQDCILGQKQIINDHIKITSSVSASQQGKKFSEDLRTRGLPSNQEQTSASIDSSQSLVSETTSVDTSQLIRKPSDENELEKIGQHPIKSQDPDAIETYSEDVIYVKRVNEKDFSGIKDSEILFLKEKESLNFRINQCNSKEFDRINCHQFRIGDFWVKRVVRTSYITTKDIEGIYDNFYNVEGHVVKSLGPHLTELEVGSILKEFYSTNSLIINSTLNQETSILPIQEQVNPSSENPGGSGPSGNGPGFDSNSNKNTNEETLFEKLKKLLKEKYGTILGTFLAAVFYKKITEPKQIKDLYIENVKASDDIKVVLFRFVQYRMFSSSEYNEYIEGLSILKIRSKQIAEKYDLEFKTYPLTAYLKHFIYSAKKDFREMYSISQKLEEFKIFVNTPSAFNDSNPAFVKFKKEYHKFLNIYQINIKKHNEETRKSLEQDLTQVEQSERGIENLNITDLM